MTISERFWSKVDRSGDCWIWRGGSTSQGYGSFKIGGSNHPAHRVAYALTYGPIPQGRVIRHKCDRPGCVRPEHLLSGTDADNIADKVERNRQAKGEANGRAKLTAAQVVTIRARAATGERIIDLAREYGVSRRAIEYIVQRVNWASVA